MHLDLASTVDIGGGVEMPRLGFGTYKSPMGEVEDAVAFALKLGYRGVDTASLYANEEGVAEGIRRSGVAREQVFLTTKVWNDEQGYEGTHEALGRSLKRLGTDYVDLYLVHWPIKAHMADTWRAMEEILASGAARAIGVCNHLPEHLELLMRTANVRPSVDQVEFHPWLQQPALQAYLAEHDITLEAWAPLMKGRICDVPELVEIAEKHGVTPAQVSVRWILEQGHVTIPKSVHSDRIAENADVFGFSLADDEMVRIASLDQEHRFGPDPHTYAW